MRSTNQALLSRASRAIGSSGDLFGSFWVSKRNTSRQYAGTKKGHRKVVALAGHPFAVAPNTYLI